MTALNTYEAIGIFDKKLKRIVLHIAVPKDDFAVSKIYDISSKKVDALFILLTRGDSTDVSEVLPTEFLSREIYYTDIDSSITNSKINWKGKKIRLVVFHDESFKKEKAKHFYECFQNLKNPYDLKEICPAFIPETSGGSILVGI